MDRELASRIARTARIIRILGLAYASGLDVSAADIDDHYRRFNQWYDAEISTDYLILTTGISYTRGHHQ